MTLSILGEHIRLIRPKKINIPIIRKSDQPKPTYNKRPKTIKENSGKCISVCIRLKNGAIRSIRKGLHIDVLEVFSVDPLNVDKVGWELEGGRFVWR